MPLLGRLVGGSEMVAGAEELLPAAYDVHDTGFPLGAGSVEAVFQG
ncbi:hypothetical protein [Streptomyces fractus]